VVNDTARVVSRAVSLVTLLLTAVVSPEGHWTVWAAAALVVGVFVWDLE